MAPVEATPHDMRPKAKATPAARGATAPPVTKKTTTVTPTLWQQAGAQAQDAYDAASQPILGQQQASDAYYAQRQKDAAASASALAQILKDMAPGVSAPYDAAAQNQGLLAKGFSQGMQDAINGDANKSNDLLAQLNSPGRIDPHAGQAADVLYGLGGYIPGDQWLKTGAAFGSAAALQPDIALRQGAEWGQAAAISGAAAHSDFDSKLSELAAKIPGDTETNFQKLQQLALADKKFALAVSKDKFDRAITIANQKLALAKYRTSIDEFNTRTKLTVARMNQQAQEFATRQANADRNYQLSLARLGISEKRLQLSIAQNAFKQANGGYTAAQVARFETKLDALAANKLTHPVNGAMPTPQYQSKDGKWHDITPDTAVPSGARTRNTTTYAAFITAALKKGIPVQIALDRANQLWPETQRALPDSLKNLPAVAAQAAQQVADYNKMTGVGAWGGVKPGKFIIAPNADRSGVSIQPVVKSFAAALAGRLNRTVTIGTGTNHNEMTTDGNVSDHWTGHAEDITKIGSHAFNGTGPSSVDSALTRAGQQALILAGADPTWARRQTGGLFNIDTPLGRVQIIFNTFQGGNHYNHLHVGIK